MANYRLNQFRSSSIPDAGAIRSNDVRPREVVIPARCSIHRKAILVLVRMDGGDWKLVQAVIAPEPKKTVLSSSTGIQLQNPIQLNGRLVISGGLSGMSML